MNYEDPQDGILAEIQRERGQQDAKWGEQNHPMAYGARAVSHYGQQAQYFKELNDMKAEGRTGEGKERTGGNLTWDSILLEEVYEALEKANDPAAMRAELIQVGAVAVAMVECIDRAATRAQS